MIAAQPGAVLAAFLAERFPGASLDTLAGDASTRRFWRIRQAASPTSYVVMDYGQPFEVTTDDVLLHAVFRRARLPVAEIVEIAPEAGCLILEDLGDLTLERALMELPGENQAPARSVLLHDAVTLAARVAVSGTGALAVSGRAAGPALDRERFEFEMDFFLDHFAVGLCGMKDLPAELHSSLHRLASLAADGPRVLCHRDYHSRNLMVRPDGSLVMVDIQDARWGPDSYDLASLLDDAYIEIDAAVVSPLVDHYLDAIGARALREPFGTRLTLVAFQRMIKALGSFGYQISSRGAQRYRPSAERIRLRLRTRLATHPATQRLGELMLDCGLLEPLPEAT